MKKLVCPNDKSHRICAEMFVSRWVYVDSRGEMLEDVEDYDVNVLHDIGEHGYKCADCGAKVDWK